MKKNIILLSKNIESKINSINYFQCFNHYLSKITNLKSTIIIGSLVFLQSCQLSFTFHKARKEQNSEINFTNLKSYSINNKHFTISRDSIISSFDIFNDTIKVNKTFDIASMNFKSKSGNLLTGLLLTPNKNIREDLLILHFHGSGGNVLTYHLPMMQQLVEKGFQVFTFDYSGYGFSEGKATRKNVLEDAFSALYFIKNSQELKHKKIIIYGQSYGGYLASVVGSNSQNDIDGLIIEGAFYSHRKEAVHVAGFMANIVCDGIRAEKEIRKNFKPILIIHSKEDKLVPIKFGRKLFEEANEPKYLFEIDKNHLAGLYFYQDTIALKIKNIFK
jgi:esterase/lipase